MISLLSKVQDLLLMSNPSLRVQGIAAHGPLTRGTGVMHGLPSNGRRQACRLHPSRGRNWFTKTQPHFPLKLATRGCGLSICSQLTPSWLVRGHTGPINFQRLSTDYSYKEQWLKQLRTFQAPVRNQHLYSWYWPKVDEAVPSPLKTPSHGHLFGLHSGAPNNIGVTLHL